MLLKRPHILLLFLFGIALGLVGAACLQEEDEQEEVDEEALIAINDYVREMTAVMPDVKIDLQSWVRKPHADDMPLNYDRERMMWLREHKQTIEEIRDKHLDTDFPEAKEVADWDVVVVRGEREWELDGEAWIDALEKLDNLVEELTGTIAMIIENDGELNMEQSERVKALINDIKPVVEEVRAEIFRE